MPSRSVVIPESVGEIVKVGESPRSKHLTVESRDSRTAYGMTVGADSTLRAGDRVAVSGTARVDASRPEGNAYYHSSDPGWRYLEMSSSTVRRLMPDTVERLMSTVSERVSGHRTGDVGATREEMMRTADAAERLARAIRDANPEGERVESTVLPSV